MNDNLFNFSGANKPASGNGAVALWFHIQRFGRAVPDQIG
jgi:hypothetical protein